MTLPPLISTIPPLTDVKLPPIPAEPILPFALIWPPFMTSFPISPLIPKPIPALLIGSVEVVSIVPASAPILCAHIVRLLDSLIIIPKGALNLTPSQRIRFTLPSITTGFVTLTSSTAAYHSDKSDDRVFLSAAITLQAFGSCLLPASFTYGTSGSDTVRLMFDISLA